MTTTAFRLRGLKRGVAFTPASITGLVGWWDASAIVGKNDGDKISSWTDLSGGGHNFAQGTSTYQPVYKVNIMNGHPIVRFNGSLTYLLTANPLISGTALTIAAAITRTATNHAQTIMQVEDTVPGRIILYSNALGSPNLYWDWNLPTAAADYDEIYNDTGPGTGGRVVVAMCNDSANTSALYTNGTLRDSNSGTPAFAIDATNISLGATIAQNSISDGDFGEVCLYSTSIGSTDRAALTSYLGTKWGVTVA